MAPTSSAPLGSGSVLEISLFAKAMHLSTYTLVVGESNWAVTSMRRDQILTLEYPEDDEADVFVD